MADAVMLQPHVSLKLEDSFCTCCLCCCLIAPNYDTFFCLPIAAGSLPPKFHSVSEGSLHSWVVNRELKALTLLFHPETIQKGHWCFRDSCGTEWPFLRLYHSLTFPSAQRCSHHPFPQKVPHLRVFPKKFWPLCWEEILMDKSIEVGWEIIVILWINFDQR